MEIVLPAAEARALVEALLQTDSVPALAAALEDQSDRAEVRVDLPPAARPEVVEAVRAALLHPGGSAQEHELRAVAAALGAPWARRRHLLLSADHGSYELVDEDPDRPVPNLPAALHRDLVRWNDRYAPVVPLDATGRRAAAALIAVMEAEGRTLAGRVADSLGPGCTIDYASEGTARPAAVPPGRS